MQIMCITITIVVSQTHQPNKVEYLQIRHQETSSTPATQNVPISAPGINKLKKQSVVIACDIIRNCSMQCLNLHNQSSVWPNQSTIDRGTVGADIEVKVKLDKHID